MFGDDDQNQGTNTGGAQDGHVDAPGASNTGSNLSSFNMSQPTVSEPPATDQPSEPTSAPTADEPVVEPTTNDLPTPVTLDDSNKNEPAAEPDSELLDIKKQALGQLSPLVSHLDQSPEDKFKTLMMMIQASDDQSLIKQAHEVAQQITDEKAKAQALLDIVNEINYFTQQQDS